MRQGQPTGETEILKSCVLESLSSGYRSSHRSLGFGIRGKNSKGPGSYAGTSLYKPQTEVHKVNVKSRSTCHCNKKIRVLPPGGNEARFAQELWGNSSSNLNFKGLTTAAQKFRPPDLLRKACGVPSIRKPVRSTEDEIFSFVKRKILAFPSHLKLSRRRAGKTQVFTIKSPMCSHSRRAVFPAPHGALTGVAPRAAAAGQPLLEKQQEKP